VERRKTVAERGWVAIRREHPIHTRPLEVRVFSEVGLRTVWLGGKKDMSSHQQLDLVTRHWQAIEYRREELGPGPWSITLLGGGLSLRVWRSEALSALYGIDTNVDLVHWAVHNSGPRALLVSSARQPQQTNPK
jgi:hypothetical protein